MKQAHVETARNVVNGEQVDEYLAGQVAQHPAIEVWITKVLRKWLMTKAPTAKFEGVAQQEGVPDWLKRAMDTNTAEEVVLNGELTNTLMPIFDYLENLVEEKPNQDQTRISFDQAVAGSKKWHEAMAKKAARAKPIEEDGTKVIHTFPNGWYWVHIFGKNSMKREGDMMGHCVGQNAAFFRAVGLNTPSYFTQHLAGKKEIYSLRDPKNDPHCTIEINNLDGNRAINQIKGKANREVKEEYLPMVEAFLKSMKWDTVNFDGARPLAAKILEHRGSKAFKGAHGYSIVRDITHYYSDKTFYTITSPDGQSRQYAAYDFGSLSAGAAEDFLSYLLDNRLYMSASDIIHNHAYQRGRWDQEPVDDIGYMLRPKDEFAHVFSRAISRGDTNAALLVHMDSSLIGYVGKDVVLTEAFATGKQVFPFLEKMISVPNATVYTLSTKDSAPVKSTKLTDFYRHRHAGASVARNGDATQILDSFLVALRLPNVATIKHATVALRGKELNDAEVKHAGVPTGGNSTMAYPMVLALSALGNKPEALTYLCSKPHALRNWLEVMNNGMAAFLDRMKFTDDIKQRIHAILYNEYVRLVPTPTELANLDISLSDKKAIAEASKGMKRNDPAASKALWS